MSANRREVELSDTGNLIQGLGILKTLLERRNREKNGLYLGTKHIEAIDRAIAKIGELSLYEIV